jgi:phosphatidylserine/phosphatidylglycerophosphate/cardiolipin synthase-like enzyme
MKRFLASLTICFAICVFAYAADCPEIHVYFAPPGGCIDAIVAELNKAQKTIRIQAYTFSSKSIAEALVNASKRGIKVEAILDKSQRMDRYTEATTLAHAGVRTLIDAQHAVAHNKIMIIDDETVITGSLNFTRNVEERNAENVLVIRDKTVAEEYTKNWHDHEGHSEVYGGK